MQTRTVHNVTTSAIYEALSDRSAGRAEPGTKRSKANKGKIPNVVDVGFKDGDRTRSVRVSELVNPADFVV